MPLTSKVLSRKNPFLHQLVHLSKNFELKKNIFYIIKAPSIKIQLNNKIKSKICREIALLLEKMLQL